MKAKKHLHETLPHLRTKQPIEDAVPDLLGLPFEAVTCQNSSEFKFGDLPRFQVKCLLQIMRFNWAYLAKYEIQTLVTTCELLYLLLLDLVGPIRLESKYVESTGMSTGKCWMELSTTVCDLFLNFFTRTNRKKMETNTKMRSCVMFSM